MVTRSFIRISTYEAAAAIKPSSAAVEVSSKSASTNKQSHISSKGGKKRALPPGNPVSGNDSKKLRRMKNEFTIDLSDVPAQLPVPASVNEELSKNNHLVYYNEKMNKWVARIMIEGESQYIGSYNNKEAAAMDYARAVFKYENRMGMGGQKGQKKARVQQTFIIDLKYVPLLSPIIKTAASSKGKSRYMGVYFHKQSNTWVSRITIDGTCRQIGYYEKEEDAAVDYARAVFKYNGPSAVDEARAKNYLALDLSDVPSQPLIPRKNKGDLSKYEGVSFDKDVNKWVARIQIKGKLHIGYYEKEEDAAADYARAVFKYKGQMGQRGKKKKKGQRQRTFTIGLSDVPPQAAMSKSNKNVKEGKSKYGRQLKPTYKLLQE